MKYIIILGDGMAGNPVASLGNKTLLQHVDIPNMDMLAKKGRAGMLKTVPDGFHPGSEVANMSILGYDMSKVYEGRGALEAASMGVELSSGEMAIRCNLICIDEDKIVNHSAGHITTEESSILIDFLQKELGREGVTFHCGIQYRHLLVIDGGDKRVNCTPPHDVPMMPYMPLLVKPEVDEAKDTADLLNSLILKSQELLSSHPINIDRVKRGLSPANSIWPWSPGYRPNMAQLRDSYANINKGSVISAVDLMQGIGKYAGLNIVKVEGATGLYNTNYENKVSEALKALKSEDFVYLHIEASDEAGHEGDMELKMRTIADLDRRVVKPIMEELAKWDEEVSIALLPDHPTPCELRTHTSDAVPFVIYNPRLLADSVDVYDEVSCRAGVYGAMEGDEFINEFLKN